MHNFTDSFSRQRPEPSSGFTLIELMVTIVVLGIIVAIAAPNISTQLANQRVKSTTATLVNALKEAKIESVIRRQPITVSFANDSSGTGTINIASTVNISSYSYDAKSTIEAINTIDESVATTITFEPSKRVDTGLTYTICDSNESASPRQITVSAVANISSQLGRSCS